MNLERSALSELRATYNVCCQASTVDEANDVLKHRFARWEQETTQRELVVFLRSLDWRRRMVTLCWYAYGDTRERIAESFGVSVRTVTSDLAHVREAAIIFFA